MPDLLEILKAEGKLREQQVKFVQIEELLKDGLKDIGEAKAVIQMGERACLLLAGIPFCRTTPYQLIPDFHRVVLFANE